MLAHPAHAEAHAEALKARYYPGGPAQYAKDKIEFYSSPEGRRQSRFLMLGTALTLVLFMVSVCLLN